MSYRDLLETKRGLSPLCSIEGLHDANLTLSVLKNSHVCSICRDELTNGVAQVRGNGRCFPDIGQP